MTIVEFCGAPGVGKSTLIESYVKELQKNGFRVNYLARYDRVSSKNKQVALFIFWKIRGTLSYIYTRLNKECKAFRNYTKKYPNSKVFVNRVMFCMFSLLFYRSDCDFLICDDAFIQDVTSTVHDREYSYDELEWFSSFLNRNIYDRYKITVVYCHLHADENLRRIKRRNNPGDRFNIGSDEDMENRLNIKKHNIKSVINKIHYENLIDIDTESMTSAIPKLLSYFR